MKIFDCFMYFDEDLLLDIRLNILNEVVDFFVIVESTKTWQNNYKELKFNIKNFSKFSDKIVYIPVNDMPEDKNPWVRENYQRNCILRGLKNSSEDDLIIVSDLDEIPNPEKIKEFDSINKFAVFKQKFFFYKINMQSVTHPFWYGTKICQKKYLKSPQWLRNIKSKNYPVWRLDTIFSSKKFSNLKIIENGGWHFCNLKTPEKLSYKYKNMCEYDDKFIFKNSIDSKKLKIDEIKESIEQGKDLIGRNYNYSKVVIDNTFPKYILNNLTYFKDWIV